MKNITIKFLILIIAVLILIEYLYIAQKQKRSNEIKELVTSAERQLLELNKQKY